MNPQDLPNALRYAEEQEARTSRIREPHVAPLNELVDRIRKERGPDYHIPYFDPCDGGIHAKILILMEAPGPKAIGPKAGGSGFVSRNNPDPTASNLCKILQEADIPRSETVLWNVVPWYLGDGDKIQTATPKHLKEAGADLEALLVLLPQVEVVVLLGKKAQAGYKALKPAKGLTIFCAPHPSAQVINVRPASRGRIVAEFGKAKQQIRR